MKKIVLISAHADDEVFGMGGSLCHFRDQGFEIHWLILTKLWEPRWDSQTLQKRQEEILKISKQLKFSSTTQWDYKDNGLDQVGFNELQTMMIQYLDQIQPDTIFTPGPWDFNFEHRIAFELVEASTKPSYSPYIQSIIAYEIPSSTDWTLGQRKAPQANWYLDINQYLEEKWELCSTYSDEVYNFPHPRSEKGVQSFAHKRACESGCMAAEAFWIMRKIGL